MLNKALSHLSTVSFTFLIYFFNGIHGVKSAENNYLPLSAYSALKSKSMLTVSPNGKMIAYRMTDKNKDLFVIVDTTKSKMVSAINIADIQPKKAYFINNKQLLFIASRYQRLAGYKGKYNVNTALVFNIDDKKIKVLLRPGGGIATGQTELGNVVGISNDGNWAYMPAYVGKENSVLKYSLMAVNLKKPSKTPYIHTKGTADTIDYFMHPHTDEVLARERYNNDDNLHSIEVLKDGQWQLVFKEETPYKTKSFNGITDDGKSLVVLENSINQGSVYYLLSLKSGKLSAPLFVKEGVEIASTLSNINRIIYGVQYAGFKPEYAFFNKQLKNKLSLIKEDLPNSIIYIVDHTQDWQKTIFYVEGDGLVGDYLFLENNKIGHVASARAHIPWEQVNNVIEFSFKARDGLTIPTLLTIPNKAIASNEKYPAIVFPHGGPESYDTVDFNWLSQYFASRGFLVIQPQFRGSSGFGAEHTLKGRGEWGKKMQDDLSDAVKKLVDMGEIDKNKVCIVGSSYGGYAALAGAAFTPNLYKCAIAINGVSDIDFMMENDRKNYGKNHWVISYWDDVLKRNKLPDEHLKNISPINFVNKITTPVLLIASLHDKVVNPRQSSRMYDALNDADKKVNYVEIEEEGHHLLNAKSRLQVLQAIDEFIAKYNPVNF
ncbi:MAG: prolyl oligopeptidase family serine peptidase [Colwellia sp.]